MEANLEKSLKTYGCELDAAVYSFRTEFEAVAGNYFGGELKIRDTILNAQEFVSFMLPLYMRIPEEIFGLQAAWADMRSPVVAKMIRQRMRSVISFIRDVQGRIREFEFPTPPQEVYAWINADETDVSEPGNEDAKRGTGFMRKDLEHKELALLRHAELYQVDLLRLLHSEAGRRKMTERIRAATDLAEAILIEKKYRSAPTFSLYDMSGGDAVGTILERVEELNKILDFFQIDYPPPTDDIAAARKNQKYQSAVKASRAMLEHQK